MFDRQSGFSLDIARLRLWAHQRGYKMTLGDAYRDPRLFGPNGEHPYSHPRSLHRHRLAVDWNVVLPDGRFATTYDDYLPLGEHWERLNDENCWGGRFAPADDPGCDPPHFSRRWGGMK
jgi:hypothetical protein